MRVGWITALLVAWTCAPAAAETLVLTPVRDNTLFEDSDGDTSNGAGPALFAGRTAGGRMRRALVQFDLASHLPAAARLDSATLTLHVSNAPNPILRRFTLHRVEQPWGEAGSFSTGGTGAAADDGDATWIHTAYPTSRWITAGGDFDPTASASLLVAGIGPTVWSAPAMKADIEAWAARPETNHGWLLLGDEDQPGSARRFDSREADAADDRPTLTIFYTILSASRFETWGSIKARYR